MVIYRVIHKYKTDKHFEIKEIGVFDSYKKATDAIDIVKNKNGFKDYQDCFSIKKLFKLFKPALLNNIYWKDGFDTVTFFYGQFLFVKKNKNKCLYSLGNFL